MLSGKTALITGAGRGIGRAIAIEMAKMGASVAVIYAGNAQAANETVRLVQNHGDKAKAYCCNVADYAAVTETVKAVLEDFGGIDILVNNAGITKDALVPMMKPEDFAAVMDVNLNGAFYMIKQLYPHMMRKRQGRIINITSISGLMGNAGQANYAAAKAGMIGLTKTIAKELAGRGVTCNAIAPGFIETDMTATLSQKVKEAAVAEIPMRHMGSPEDIAHMAVFLASDKAGYITGEVIKVDGGLYI